MAMTESKSHWEAVYMNKQADAVSWYQKHAACSLSLIHRTGVPKSAAIIDIGAGASTLVDDLTIEGYTNVSVLDLSAAALSASKQRLGSRGAKVQWLEADVTTAVLPRHGYDVWHDRAVFHFLTEPQQRHAYVEKVLCSVKPGGHVIVATFAEDGPATCSGLPVMRYSADGLHEQFGDAFALVHHAKEAHRTPSGGVQQFVYCYCRVVAS
jgi:2-polyprenyl-3-methyl-5-hydroxy-6-metoxy-1,4-benzoquinol methylase